MEKEIKKYNLHFIIGNSFKEKSEYFYSLIYRLSKKKKTVFIKNTFSLFQRHLLEINKNIKEESFYDEENLDLIENEITNILDSGLIIITNKFSMDSLKQTINFYKHLGYNTFFFERFKFDNLDLFLNEIKQIKTTFDNECDMFFNCDINQFIGELQNIIIINKDKIFGKEITFYKIDSNCELHFLKYNY